MKRRMFLQSLGLVPAVALPRQQVNTQYREIVLGPTTGKGNLYEEAKRLFGAHPGIFYGPEFLRPSEPTRTQTIWLRRVPYPHTYMVDLTGCRPAKDNNLEEYALGPWQFLQLAQKIGPQLLETGEECSALVMQVNKFFLLHMHPRSPRRLDASGESAGLWSYGQSDPYWLASLRS